MRWWPTRKRDADLERELRADLELEEEEQRERGMSPEEARVAARRAFGNATLIREQTREAWGWGAWERLWQDVRYALRQMGRAPGFALAAIFTLAIGIGACTAIFSVTDAVLLRPLPYPRPQRIVRIWEQAPDGQRMNIAQLNFDDFRSQNHSFASMAEYGFVPESVTGGSEPVRLTLAVVSRDFFKVFGVRPYLGRAFAADEMRAHGTPAVLVSYGYWKQDLGSAQNLSQFHLAIAGKDYSVVGVMPAGFDFPSGASAWIPSELDPDTSTRTAHNWRGIGRLRDGITVAQARADLGTIARRLKAEYGREVDLNNAAVVPLADALVGDVRRALLVLCGAVGLLLLIACANVAGLLIARTMARTRELAVRTALGAGRGRLVHQFVAESLVLSLSAGLAGLLIAGIAVRMLPAILPADLPRQGGIAMNISVLLFALAVTMVVAVSLGLFAAWRAGRADLRGALNAGAHQHSGSRGAQRLRSALVTGEIAMTLLVLVVAGLLGRSFLRLIATSPGFRSDHLITMQFSFPPRMSGQDSGVSTAASAAVAGQVHLIDDLVNRLRALPGAESVGVAGALPVAAGDNLAEGQFLILDGIQPPANFKEWGVINRNPNHVGQALYCVTGGGYFTTLGVPLLRGRLFDERDGLNSPNVAVISEALARQRWPNQDPIGHVIEFGNMDGNLKPMTIVGVVGDVRVRGLDLPPGKVIYVDYRQRGMNENALPVVLMRTDMPEDTMVPAARAVFHEVMPDAPVTFASFGAEMGGWLAERRFLLLLVGAFAVAALALASVGLYGLIAYFVTRRTQEIGIRMAIGAQRGSILRLVVGEGLRLAISGVVVGVIGSLLVARLLSSLLFGISPADPLTFVGVALLLVVVTVAACGIPARRAMSIDPVKALRYE
ncbi:MAG: ABC transporter permease [Acidobacteriaceae bacterium]